jgi:CBS domain containing-hemolysin-like protein
MGGESNSLGGDLISLLLVGVLILVNAFFVAAEFALVSVRRTRIEELVTQGKRGAQAVRSAVQDPDRFIAATQLGITLASLGLGWVGEPALSHLIDPLTALIPIPKSMADLTAHGISAALAFAVITFLHVVLGELTPKSVALQRPEQTAMFVAQPLIGVEWLFKPAIWLLNGTGNAVVRLFGLRPAGGHELAHSAEEIRMLAAASADQGILEESEYDMLDSIFDLRRMTVRQLMIPRTEMIALPAGASLRDAVELQKENPHGKFPVYEKDIDHIVGVLYLRDVIEHLATGRLDSAVQRFIREAIFVPETARINTALRTFRDKRERVAIVLDEYSGTAGMLTLEDILEEIAGDLPDQFDTDEAPDIVQQQDGQWLVNGLALIGDVNDALNLKLIDENYDTIGGYVMGKLERIPKKGDEIQIDHMHFRVERVDGMRIDQLRISLGDGKPKSGG